jgi:hypothetical protein
MFALMTRADSNLDILAIAQVRRLLAPPKKRKETLWPVLGAAAFAAVAAMALALTTIMAPPANLTHLQKDADGVVVGR